MICFCVIMVGNKLQVVGQGGGFFVCMVGLGSEWITNCCAQLKENCINWIYPDENVVELL
jgi:hypothetical protein